MDEMIAVMHKRVIGGIMSLQASLSGCRNSGTGDPLCFPRHRHATALVAALDLLTIN